MKKFEEYDFSEISTDALIYGDNKQFGYTCSGIRCDICPFIHRDCMDINKTKIQEYFKRELERRLEEEKNKMPELEHGMIVDLRSESTGEIYTDFMVLSPDWVVSLDGKNYSTEHGVEVIKIYKSNTKLPMQLLKEYSHVIWEKDDQLDKIQELEKVLAEHNKEHEEFNKKIQDQIAELKK